MISFVAGSTVAPRWGELCLERTVEKVRPRAKGGVNNDPALLKFALLHIIHLQSSRQPFFAELFQGFFFFLSEHDFSEPGPK